jgi:hypothetical protein
VNQQQPGWYADPEVSGQERYWFGDTWSKQTRPAGDAAPAVMTLRVSQFNEVTEVRFRRGWVGFFARENQHKALTRAVQQINSSGRSVVSTAPDEWSWLSRLGWAFVALITLGIVVRAPNLLVVTAPLS